MTTPIGERPTHDDTWVGLAWMGVAILVVGLIMWLAWPALSRSDDRDRATLIAPFVMNAALQKETSQALQMAHFQTRWHKRGEVIIPPASRYGIVFVDKDEGHIRVSWGPLSPEVCEAVQSVVKDKPAETAPVRISVKDGPTWSTAAAFLHFDCKKAPTPLILVFKPQASNDD